jgi:hypothetical protein
VTGQPVPQNSVENIIIRSGLPTRRAPSNAVLPGTRVPAEQDVDVATATDTRRLIALFFFWVPALLRHRGKKRLESVGPGWLVLNAAVSERRSRCPSTNHGVLARLLVDAPEEQAQCPLLHVLHAPNGRGQGLSQLRTEAQEKPSSVSRRLMCNAI